MTMLKRSVSISNIIRSFTSFQQG